MTKNQLNTRLITLPEEEEKTTKYAQRFINIFYSCMQKEQVPQKIMTQAIIQAAVVESVAYCIESAAAANAPMPELENDIRNLAAGVMAAITNNFEERMNDAAYQAQVEADHPPGPVAKEGEETIH